MHAQLPALKRLDLLVKEADFGRNPGSELRATLARLPLLAGLKSLALQAWSSCGALRHLKLPPVIEASVPTPATVLLCGRQAKRCMQQWVLRWHDRVIKYEVITCRYLYMLCSKAHACVVAGPLHSHQHAAGKMC